MFHIPSLYTAEHLWNVAIHVTQNFLTNLLSSFAEGCFLNFRWFTYNLSSLSIDRHRMISHLLSDLDRSPRKISISKSPCEVDGLSGICMFHLKCSTGNGKVLGMCREGFLMGVCCQMSSNEASGKGDEFDKEDHEGEEIQNETSENSVKKRWIVRRHFPL